MHRAAAVLLQVLAGPAQGQEAILGTVTAVEDGTTLTVAGTRLRLWGIRAPAADQRCTGTEAGTKSCDRPEAQWLEALTAGQALVCRAYWISEDGTVVGRCRRRTEDLAAVLVRLGLAVDDPRLSGGNYQAEQEAARVQRAGWWETLDP